MSEVTLEMGKGKLGAIILGSMLAGGAIAGTFNKQMSGDVVVKEIAIFPGKSVVGTVAFVSGGQVLRERNVSLRGDKKHLLDERGQSLGDSSAKLLKAIDDVEKEFAAATAALTP